MKKILTLVVALFACATLSAQPGDAAVTYYGVDFSKTRVFGATETGWQFKEAFGRINSLVIGEWPKYNPGQFLSLDIAASDISPTTRLNDAIDPSTIITTSSNHSVPLDEVVDMVRGYELRETEGTGLVIICELLDKSTYTGTFIVATFDIATREILHVRPLTGKAHGFGLRNYWAGSLNAALRSTR